MLKHKSRHHTREQTISSVSYLCACLFICSRSEKEDGYQCT